MAVRNHATESQSTLIDVRVNGLGGPLCTLFMDTTSSIFALKKAIAKQTGISSRQQRLLNGMEELAVDGVLGDIVKDRTQVTVIMQAIEDGLRAEMARTGNAAMAKARMIAQRQADPNRRNRR